MTQAFPTRFQLQNKKEKQRQFSSIHTTKSDPFDPRDEVPEKSFVSLTRSHEEELFETFLKKEEDKEKKIPKGQ